MNFSDKAVAPVFPNTVLVIYYIPKLLFLYLFRLWTRYWNIERIQAWS